MVIIGEYSTKVTTGNRIAIPKNFRNAMGNELIITRGFEPHLILVNQQQFQELTRGVTNLPFILGEKRDVTRYLLSNAYEVQPDSQGRFVIPEKLIKHVHLKEKAVFIGLGEWVEIWDELLWERHQQTLDKHSAQMANRLVTLQQESKNS